MDVHWLLLSGAIGVEIVATTSLKLSDGLARLEFLAGSLLLYGVSFVLLAMALKVIPIGTAYAIWSGIGTAAIVTIGVIWFSEAMTASRLLFIGLIIIGTVGLQITTD